MAKAFQKAGASWPLFVGQIAKEMEELTTAALGTLLGINTRTSAALGCGAISLSLLQKVQLLCEIRGMDKVVGEKMMRVVQIVQFVARTKIETVEDLFTGTGILGKDIYRDLDNWYYDGKAKEMSLQERDRKIQPIIISMLIEIKKSILDCMKNEFVEKERRDSFNQFNSLFVESIMNQLKTAELEMIGRVAADHAESTINKHLDEMAQVLKKARRSKGS